MSNPHPGAEKSVAHVSWPELTGEDSYDGGVRQLLDRDEEILRETHRAVEHRSWAENPWEEDEDDL